MFAAHCIQQTLNWFHNNFPRTRIILILMRCRCIQMLHTQYWHWQRKYFAKTLWIIRWMLRKQLSKSVKSNKKVFITTMTVPHLWYERKPISMVWLGAHAEHTQAAFTRIQWCAYKTCQIYFGRLQYESDFFGRFFFFCCCWWWWCRSCRVCADFCCGISEAFNWNQVSVNS